MRGNLKTAVLGALLLGPIPRAGCYAVAAGTAAGAYAYNVGDENKANFAKTNADRQAHGLPPLTWDEYMKPGTNPTPQANGASASGGSTAK
jgi:hypothetical protein